MTYHLSKKLEHDDQSGFEFSKELLGGDSTAAINFDRLQRHPQLGYIIIEYLLCEDSQKVTPYSSHPNKYWYKNAAKFLALWKAKMDFNATLYLVNYAKKGTRAENEILLIEVLDIDEYGITNERVIKYTRKHFGEWFRKLNKECLAKKNELIEDIYWYKSVDDIGKITLKGGKYQGETIRSIYMKDIRYLEWLKEQAYPYSKAVLCYLEKKAMEEGFVG